MKDYLRPAQANWLRYGVLAAAPAVSTAFIKGNTVTLLFNTDIVGRNGFVFKINGVKTDVLAIVRPNVITERLTLASVVKPSDIVIMDYAGAALEDWQGRKITGFADMTINNITGQSEITSQFWH